jgi:hypothetical protein|tara:strand:+ start:124 stop:309 length:186 start_codon:yes stop_codon:yes gene_type:complete
MNFKIDIWIQDIKGEKCATIHNLGGFGRRTMENGRNTLEIFERMFSNFELIFYFQNLDNTL